MTDGKDVNRNDDNDDDDDECVAAVSVSFFCSGIRVLIVVVRCFINRRNLLLFLKLLMLMFLWHCL